MPYRKREPLPLETLLSSTDLADLLAVPAKTVRYWRAQGRGPRYIKVGRFVRYHPKDVEEWLHQSRDEWPGRS